LGLLAGQGGHIGAAQRAFERVLSIDSKRQDARVQLARCLVHTGDHGRALQQADLAKSANIENPSQLDVLATVYSHLGLQAQALSVYQQAVHLAPENVEILSNTVAALIFLGRSSEAEQLIQKVLSLSAGHHRCHWQLSRIRQATDDTHIRQMESVREGLPEGHPHRVFFNYALGKEYEDLGQWPQAWQCYQTGASQQRASLDYNAGTDAKLFDALTDTYDPSWFSAHVKDGDAGEPGPIFVLGLPRSGTTLTERIIAAHSTVQSLGELSQFPLAVKRAAGISSRSMLDSDIARAAGALERGALGGDYLRQIAHLRNDQPRFTDKLPLNALYIPLIAAALPTARFVCLTRDPMDSGFAMYKQLFADAYPYSYDQDEIAAYLRRFRSLMALWSELLPQRLTTLSYEDLVQQPEQKTRALLDFLGLPFEPACLSPHQSDTAVATASAAQVRKPIHSESVSRWRNFEDFLGPLAAGLKSVKS
jgi:tetratricopeptide (TPR) repeat protein